MIANRSVLLCAMSLVLVLGGGPTEVPDTTNASPDPGTTEAPPVAIHNDSNDSGGDSGDAANDDGGDTITDPNTTTVTSDDPDTPPDAGTPNNPPSDDPNDGPDPDTVEPPSSAIAGTFGGTLTWDNSQFLAGGDPFPSGSEDVAITAQFDDDGALAAIFFRGFVDSPDGTAEVQQVGDTLTITECLGDAETEWGDCGSFEFVQTTLTRTIRVLETDYSETGAFIRFRVRHEKTAGQLTESGRGFQTINLSVSGDLLTYESTMTYDVTLSTTDGGPTIEAGEISTAAGSLSRQ